MSIVTTGHKGHADEVLNITWNVAGLLCHPQGAQKHLVRPKKLNEEVKWQAREKNPGSPNVNYGRQGWTDGKKAVSWTNYHQAQTSCRVFYRGRQVFASSPPYSNLSAPYFWESFIQHNTPKVMAACVRKHRIVVLLTSGVMTYYPAINGVVDEDPRYPYLEVISIDSVSGMIQTLHTQKLPKYRWYAPSEERASSVISASASPSGELIVLFLNDRIIQFSIGEEGDDVTVSDKEHPSPAPIEIHSTFTPDTEPGNLHNDNSSSSVDHSSQWHIGVRWVRAGDEGYAPAWVTRDLSITVNRHENNWVTRHPNQDRQNTDAVLDSTVLDVIEVPGTGAHVLADYHINHNTQVREFVTITQTQSGRSLFRIMQGVDYQTGALCLAAYDEVPWTWVYPSPNPEGARTTPLFKETRVFFQGEELYAGEEIPAGGAGGVGERLPNQVSIHYAITGHLGNGTYYRDPFGVMGMFRVPAALFEKGWDGFAGCSNDAVFVSIPLPPGVSVNFMTDNSSLAGVFPEGSGVNLSGDFAPIVPFSG